MACAGWNPVGDRTRARNPPVAFCGVIPRRDRDDDAWWLGAAEPSHAVDYGAGVARGWSAIADGDAPLASSRSTGPSPLEQTSPGAGKAPSSR